MLARLFHASKTGVGMTVSAATLGVALSAPIFGALTERLPRKRVIVASLLGISLPTLLAATSTSLAQLVFWRFLQGITVPGVIAVLVTYIGEEWPADQVALIISFYVSGTALGGFIGRVSAGILADRFSWRVSFLALGAAALAGAGAVAHGCRTDATAPSRSIGLTRFPRFPTRCKGSFAAADSSQLLQSDLTCCSHWSASSPGSLSISPLRRSTFRLRPSVHCSLCTWSVWS